MDTIIVILQILIFGILIVAYFLMKNLLPSYFSEKGKNLATKEDIEEITEKIKAIESKIKIKESGEIDYHSLKRKIVLEYFGSYNNWERMTTSGHSYYDSHCESKNDMLIKSIENSRFEYNLKEGEIELFIEDSQFYQLRKDLTMKVIELQHKFAKHCLDLNYIVKFETEMETRHKKIRESKDEFHKERIKRLKEIMPHRNALISYLEEVLKESFN